ncbi:MAG: alpha/beta fold hydrolase [Promethearchaeota archaeon]
MIEEIELEFKPHPLYGIWWLPDNKEKMKSIVVSIHGLGAHAKREFYYMGPFLEKKGHAVFAIDLPGFGHWKGLKGNVKNWNVFRNAVQLALNKAHERFPDLPLFLMGISLGGLTILDFGLNGSKPRPVPIMGFLAYVPAVDYAVEIKWYQKVAIAIIGTLAGNLKYESEDMNEVKCHDPNSIAWQEDEMHLQFQRLGFLLKIWMKMREIRRKSKNWKDNLLMISADEDELVKTSAIKEWAEKARDANKGRGVIIEHHSFKDTYHGVCHELRRDEIFALTSNFIEKIIKLEEK